MKTITVTAHRRPNYLMETLESIRKNNLSGYEMTIMIDPGHPEVKEVADGVDFMPVTVICPESKAGPHWNNKRALDHVFSSGSRFNVAIEEDTPISPDALDMANWFLDGKDGACLCLSNLQSDPSRPLDVVRIDCFNTLAWGVTSEMFRDWVHPNWMKDWMGWDHSLNAAIGKSGMKAFMPVFSRVTHIGRENGTYCTPELHDSMFGNVKISEGGYGLDFNLVR